MGSIEYRRIRSPLGIRFWDQATNTPVRDSLRVSVAPVDQPQRSTGAFPTPGGVYAFQGLPGMHAWEQADPDTDTSPPTQRPFVLQVHDLAGRFLPLAMSMGLPWNESGLCLSALRRTTQAGDPPGFFLFSSASRPASADMAVIEGQLWDISLDQPAAHALLEVTLDQDGSMWHGIADERGCVRVLLPYPSPETTAGSPPIPLTPSLRQWSLAVRVRSAVSDLDALPGTELPDLRDIAAQPYAWVQLGAASNPVAEAQLSLLFGQPLVFRTDALPRLWISPAASPPTP